MFDLLKPYLMQIRIAIWATVFIAYSLGLWHVCSKYTTAGWESEKTAMVQATLDATTKNQALADTIGKKIEDTVGNIKITQQTIQQKVIHEITKEPVYTNCVTTPDGVRLIESAIDNKGQPSNSKPATLP